MSLARAFDGGCRHDSAATRGYLGVRYRPLNTLSELVRASGLQLLRERSAGWETGRTPEAALPLDGDHGRAAAALEFALQTIANRWKPSIVLHLADGPRRRRDLEQHLPRYVSAKVLTEQLRALEADGLVYRVDRTPAGHGRHVTYALTELGQTLGPAIKSLAQWAVEHTGDLLRGRR